MIDLKRINKHTVDELAEAILSGQYTMDDYLDAWIAWEKRQEVERRLVELEKEKEMALEKALEEEKNKEAKLVAEEAEDWNSAKNLGILGHTRYIRRDGHLLNALNMPFISKKQMSVLITLLERRRSSVSIS